MPDSLFPTMYHQFLRPDQAWFEVGGGGGGGILPYGYKSLYYIVNAIQQ